MPEAISGLRWIVRSLRYWCRIIINSADTTTTTTAAAAAAAAAAD